MYKGREKEIKKEIVKTVLLNTFFFLQVVTSIQMQPV